jgi:hypothetical protein
MTTTKTDTQYMYTREYPKICRRRNPRSCLTAACTCCMHMLHAPTICSMVMQCCRYACLCAQPCLSTVLSTLVCCPVTVAVGSFPQEPPAFLRQLPFPPDSAPRLKSRTRQHNTTGAAFSAVFLCCFFVFVTN